MSVDATRKSDLASHGPWDGDPKPRIPRAPFIGDLPLGLVMATEIREVKRICDANGFPVVGLGVGHLRDLYS